MNEAVKKKGGKGIKVPIMSIGLSLRSMEMVNMEMSVSMACFFSTFLPSMLA